MSPCISHSNAPKSIHMLTHTLRHKVSANSRASKLLLALLVLGSLFLISGGNVYAYGTADQFCGKGFALAPDGTYTYQTDASWFNNQTYRNEASSTWYISGQNSDATGYGVIVNSTMTGEITDSQTYFAATGITGSYAPDAGTVTLGACSSGPSPTATTTVEGAITTLDNHLVIIAGILTAFWSFIFFIGLFRKRI